MPGGMGRGRVGEGMVVMRVGRGLWGLCLLSPLLRLAKSEAWESIYDATRLFSDPLPALVGSSVNKNASRSKQSHYSISLKSQNLSGAAHL